MEITSHKTVLLKRERTLFGEDMGYVGGRGGRMLPPPVHFTDARARFRVLLNLETPKLPSRSQGSIH